MGKKKKKEGINLTLPDNFADMCDDRDAGLRRAFADNIGKSNEPFLDGIDFMSGMAVQGLIELEERIVGLEFYLSKNPPNEVSNQERIGKYQEEYRTLRRQIEEQLGDRFAAIYDSMKAENNECARANLDNNDGRLYSYVLPEFHADGTHEPLGERDAPWNVYNA